MDELAKVYTSEKLVEINKQNNEFYAYLSKNTGDNITTLADVETLYNTLEIEQLNNLTLPEWTKEVFGEKMKEMATMNLALYTDTEFMKRMHGGIYKNKRLVICCQFNAQLASRYVRKGNYRNYGK